MRGAGGQPSGALRGFVLATTLVVTVIAVSAIGYGQTMRNNLLDEFSLVVAAALLIIGGPAAFMWFNAMRVLGGNASAAWRV